MKEAGYIPETRFVLHDIDHESKEEALLAHSERLAIADGLLNSPVRSPIRIIKNLRACLVHVFKHMFSVFKQHYTYFHTFFHPHVFPKKLKTVV